MKTNALWFANYVMILASAKLVLDSLTIWAWLAILVVIGLLSFFVVSPASSEGDDDTGESPP